MFVFPATAAAISGTFSARLWGSWRDRRRPNLLAWGIALAMFSIASAAAAIGIAFGWEPITYKTYYLFGAILNVPVLAAGTVYLLAPRRVANAFAILVAIASAFALGTVASVHIDPAALVTSGIPSGHDVMPESVRTLSRYYSFIGFFIVVAGALWSAWRLRDRGDPYLRNLAFANLLIATGTFVVAIGSGFARYGGGSVFAVGLVVGVTIMFAGFLKTRTPVSTAA